MSKQVNDYKADRKFGDSYWREVKAALGLALVRVSTPDEDRLAATDLVVSGGTVAVRIRRAKWYTVDHYAEFTLRASKASGRRTELSKIMAGHGDYLFYGFATPDGKHLAAWRIGDLAVFRKWYANRTSSACQFYTARNSGDGFCVFRWADIPGFEKLAHVRQTPRKT